MSKQTEGPWRATFRGIDQGENWASRIPYAIERALGACVQPIADVCDQPQAEANARLIAAAPELLAACQAVQDAIGHSATVRSYELVDAAIAKATGSAS